uniref:Uncharacterized protein n=1 Tax=Trichogramma kaykai TaxID=54128 RepID=A0ABD2X9Q6_9HYME
MKNHKLHCHVRLKNTAEQRYTRTRHYDLKRDCRVIEEKGIETIKMWRHERLKSFAKIIREIFEKSEKTRLVFKKNLSFFVSKRSKRAIGFYMK